MAEAGLKNKFLLKIFMAFCFSLVLEKSKFFVGVGGGGVLRKVEVTGSIGVDAILSFFHDHRERALKFRPFEDI